MMRHAESEERLQSIRDHDRPITDEGRSSAREVHTQHLHISSLLMLCMLLFCWLGLVLHFVQYTMP